MFIFDRTFSSVLIPLLFLLVLVVGLRLWGQSHELAEELTQVTHVECRDAAAVRCTRPVDGECCAGYVLAASR